MKRAERGIRGSFSVFQSFFLAAACVTALGGCVEPGGEGGEVEAAALPAPGSIDVIRPLELAERGRVPEKEEGFAGAEVGEGTLVIAHDGRIPAFHAGDVLAGTQGGGYLVRVAGVREEAPGRIVLDTTPASLTELLQEGEIHVHYDALEYSQRLQEALEAAKAAQAEQAAEEGAAGEEDGEAIGTQAQALQVGGKAFVDLVKLSHASLPASCGVKVGGTADLDVTATLIPSIDLDLKIGAKGGGNPKPEIKKLRLVASGMLTVDAKLRGKGKVLGSCQVDLLKLAGGVPGLTLPPLTFWVGPVPVVVTTEVVPVAGAQVDLAFEAVDLTAEAHAFAGLSAGVDYQDATWSKVWDPWASANGTATVDAPGEVTAACKVSAGAELRARLYGLLGPTLGVEAYARATAQTAPPYCTYDGRIDGGVRAYAKAEAGVSVGPLDLTLVSLPLVDYEVCHFEGPDFSGAMPGASESCGG